MDEQETLTGGCACGQITFTAIGQPIRVGLCHCLTCRKATGSVFNAFAVFPADQVAIMGDSRRWEASPGGYNHFCPNCGSLVFFSEGGDEVEIMLGAFDRTDLFVPTYETWTKRRESWLCTPELTSYFENKGDVTS